MKNLIMVCALLLALPASAQDVVPASQARGSAGNTIVVSRLPEHLVLARICASEAGLQVESADCAAIHAVLVRGAARTGLSYRAYARSYSTRVFDSTRRDSRRWVAFLALDGSRPEGWPAASSWENHREAWLELLSRAERIVAGAEQPPCEADHWGGAMDRHRAERAGWTQIDCGETRNEFWVI